MHGWIGGGGCPGAGVAVATAAEISTLTAVNTDLADLVHISRNEGLRKGNFTDSEICSSLQLDGKCNVRPEERGIITTAKRRAKVPKV